MILELAGRDAVDAYVRRVARLLRAARLNAFFPDARRLRAHVQALGSDVHRGLYDRLQIDGRTGLPTYREWARVQTDRAVAPETLGHLPTAAQLADRTGDLADRQRTKRAYYEALVRRRIAPLGDMSVALRRVAPDRSTAHFHVVLDKLDASGVFVRHSIDLSQRASAWRRPLVELDEDDARHTEALRALVYRCSALDAELTRARLVADPDIAVERVIKGTVGPVFFTGVRAPASIAAVLADAPEAMIATFALDMAAVDVAADRDNDPFDDLLGAGPGASDEERGSWTEAREASGYRVFKDRKLAATRDALEGLRALCTAAGTRNVIYTA